MGSNKIFMLHLAVFQVLCLAIYSALAADSGEDTVMKEAKYLADNNCDVIKGQHTSMGPLQYASDLIIVGTVKKIGEAYGTDKDRYSASVKQDCVLKGTNDQLVINVRNLGKTNCGSNDAEINRVYLFYLSKTSDPKVFEAVTLGVKAVTGGQWWNPVFGMSCDLKKKLTCGPEGKDESKCLPVCKDFNALPEGACVSQKVSVTETFKSKYPGKTVADLEPKTTPAPASDSKSNSDNNPTYKPQGAKNTKPGNGQTNVKQNLLLLLVAFTFGALNRIRLLC